jgi:hypothetical protein
VLIKSCSIHYISEKSDDLPSAGERDWIELKEGGTEMDRIRKETEIAVPYEPTSNTSIYSMFTILYNRYFLLVYSVLLGLTFIEYLPLLPSITPNK